jgi:hypothetical protein
VTAEIEACLPRDEWRERRDLSDVMLEALSTFQVETGPSGNLDSGGPAKFGKDSAIGFEPALASLPPESVERWESIDIPEMGRESVQEIDEWTGIEFVEAKPSQEIDEWTGIEFIEAKPSQEIDQWTGIEFVEAKPSQEIDQWTGIEFVEAKPSQEIDEWTGIEFVETQRPVSIEQSWEAIRLPLSSYPLAVAPEEEWPGLQIVITGSSESSVEDLWTPMIIPTMAAPIPAEELYGPLNLFQPLAGQSITRRTRDGKDNHWNYELGTWKDRCKAHYSGKRYRHLRNAVGKLGSGPRDGLSLGVRKR